MGPNILMVVYVDPLGYLGLGNTNSSTGLGQVYDYWALGPLGYNY